MQHQVLEDGVVHPPPSRLGAVPHPAGMRQAGAPVLGKAGLRLREQGGVTVVRPGYFFRFRRFPSPDFLIFLFFRVPPPRLLPLLQG